MDSDSDSYSYTEDEKETKNILWPRTLYCNGPGYRFNDMYRLFHPNPDDMAHRSVRLTRSCLSTDGTTLTSRTTGLVVEKEDSSDDSSSSSDNGIETNIDTNTYMIYRPASELMCRGLSRSSFRLYPGPDKLNDIRVTIRRRNQRLNSDETRQIHNACTAALTLLFANPQRQFASSHLYIRRNRLRKVAVQICGERVRHRYIRIAELTAHPTGRVYQYPIFLSERIVSARVPDFVEP